MSPKLKSKPKTRHLKQEPASLGVEALRHPFMHSNNESISRKVNKLQEREQLLSEQASDAERLAASAQQRIDERVAEVALQVSQTP